MHRDNVYLNAWCQMLKLEKRRQYIEVSACKRQRGSTMRKYTEEDEKMDRIRN